MKVFYHNDADGECAGFWVKELAYAKEYIGYIEMDYGREFLFDKIKKNETVYIVDYSIEPSEMDKLLGITPNVTWIDHHISAIKKYENYDKEIRGVRYDGVAGCITAHSSASLSSQCFVQSMQLYLNFSPILQLQLIYGGSPDMPYGQLKKSIQL